MFSKLDLLSGATRIANNLLPNSIKEYLLKKFFELGSNSFTPEEKEQLKVSDHEKAEINDLLNSLLGNSDAPPLAQQITSSTEPFQQPGGKFFDSNEGGQEKTEQEKSKQDLDEIEVVKPNSYSGV
ncbi:hypothetical protein [Legionella fallonii]|uniref:Uncharacterized protein n=1 Tax=Legionella fallonii LLAP-10 TaxID=1212491 RepID=A0A098G4K4_9GAMM|nr:hypothetical protein [Legionella fallonii]CEG56901.1 protein of unknown function [Legionella fallonii LLAP-10]